MANIKILDDKKKKTNTDLNKLNSGNKILPTTSKKTSPKLNTQQKSVSNASSGVAQNKIKTPNLTKDQKNLVSSASKWISQNQKRYDNKDRISDINTIFDTNKAIAENDLKYETNKGRQDRIKNSLVENENKRSSVNNQINLLQDDLKSNKITQKQYRNELEKLYKSVAPNDTERFLKSAMSGSASAITNTAKAVQGVIDSIGEGIANKLESRDKIMADALGIKPKENKLANWFRSYEPNVDETKLNAERERIQAGVNEAEKFLLNSTESIANMMTTYGIGGGLGLGEKGTRALMSAQSFGDSYVENLELGRENIALNSALKGAVSYLTEAMPTEHLFDIVKGNTSRGFLGFISSVAKQSASEGFEEGAEYTADYLIDKIMYNDAEYNVGELLHSMGAGAFSGGIVGAGAELLNRIPNQIRNNKSKKQLQADVDTIHEMLNEGILEYDADVERALNVAQASINNYENSSVLANAVSFAKDEPVRANIDDIKAVYEKFNNVNNSILRESQSILSRKGINMRADQYALLDKNLRDQVDHVQDIANKLDIGVSFDTNLDAYGVYDPNTNSIIINPNNEQAPLTTFAHEITHSTELSDLYKNLSDLVIGGNDIGQDIDYIIGEYANRGIKLKPEDAQREYVAIELQDQLNNDAFIDRLINYNENLAFRIYEKVRSVANQDERLANVEYKFMQAFRDAGMVDLQGNPTLQYSIFGGNSGYDGYSMSNRARQAYADGKKPISQFNSDDLSYFNDSLGIKGIQTRVDSVKALKEIMQTYGNTGEWHHTSSYGNQTKFYDLDLALDNVTEDGIKNANNFVKNNKKAQNEVKKQKGNFYYLEWGGTRSHPKANEVSLKNVNIEERGSFYYVYDDNGNLIVKKKIGSNGTRAVIENDYDLQEKLKKQQERQEYLDKLKKQREESNKRYAKKVLENSGPEAVSILKKIVFEKGFEESGDVYQAGLVPSSSGNLYKIGRRPSQIDYENGLNSFFSIGEQRLHPNKNGGYDVEVWDGEKFVEKGKNENVKYSIGLDKNYHAKQETTDKKIDKFLKKASKNRPILGYYDVQEMNGENYNIFTNSFLAVATKNDINSQKVPQEAEYPNVARLFEMYPGETDIKLPNYKEVKELIKNNKDLKRDGRLIAKSEDINGNPVYFDLNLLKDLYETTGTDDFNIKYNGKLKPLTFESENTKAILSPIRMSQEASDYVDLTNLKNEDIKQLNEKISQKDESKQQLIEKVSKETGVDTETSTQAVDYTENAIDSTEEFYDKVVEVENDIVEEIKPLEVDDTETQRLLNGLPNYEENENILKEVKINNELATNYKIYMDNPKFRNSDITFVNELFKGYAGLDEGEYEAKLGDVFNIKLMNNLIENEKSMRQGEIDSATELLFKHGQNTVSRQKTLEQNLDIVANANVELRQKFRDTVEFQRAVAQAKAKEIRDKGNSLINRITKELGIKNYSKENKAIQWIIEGHTDQYADPNDKSLGWQKYNVSDLAKDFNYKMPNGELAYKNIIAAANLMSEFYDERYENINDTRLNMIYGDVDAQAKIELDKQRGKLKTARDELKMLRRTMLRDKTPALIGAYEQQLSKVRNLESKLDSMLKKHESGDDVRRQRLLYRENYAPHLGKKSVIETLKGKNNVPTEIAGTSDYTQPNSTFAGFFMQQGMGEYEANALEGLRYYIETSADVEAYDPFISYMRQFTNNIRKNDPNNQMNNVVEYLKDYTDSLAGKTNYIDRALGKWLNRPVVKAIELLNNKVKANAVVGSFRTAISQFYNLPNALGVYSMNGISDDYLLKGMYNYASSINNEASARNSSPFLSLRYFDPDLGASGLWGNVKYQAENFTKGLLTFGDEITTKVIWEGAYQYALDNNIDNAINYADDITRRSVAGRSKGEVPLTLQSRFVNFIVPFQVETNNAWQTLKSTAKSDKGLSAFTHIAVASFIMNSISGALFNDRVLPDIIYAIYKGIRQDEDDDRNKAEALAFNTLGTILEAMPGGSYIPFLMGWDEDTIQERFGKELNPSRYGVGNIGLKAGAEVVNEAFDFLDDPTLEHLFDAGSDLTAKFLMPGGGNQAQRSIEAMQSYGLVPQFVGNELVNEPVHYTGSGNVGFVQNAPSDDWLDFAKGILSGKYATKAGQEYIDNGFKSLGSKGTERYNSVKDLGLDAKQSEQLIKDISSIQSMKDENGNTINNSRASQVRELIDSLIGWDNFKSKVSLEDAKSYNLNKTIYEMSNDDFKAFNDSLNKPKSSLSVDDLNDYDKDTYKLLSSFTNEKNALELTKTLSSAKGIKGSNGKTIRNSKSLALRKELEDEGLWDEYVESGENTLNIGKGVSNMSDDEFANAYNELFVSGQPTSQTASGTTTRKTSTRKSRRSSDKVDLNRDSYETAKAKIDSYIAKMNLKKATASNLQKILKNYVYNDNIEKTVADIRKKYMKESLYDLIKAYQKDNPYADMSVFGL